MQKTQEKIYRTLSEFENDMPEREKQELDALGQVNGNLKWAIADKARLYIDEYGWSAMWTYIAISRRVDYKKDSVRHFYYVSKFYDGTGLRERFHLLSFSIFKYCSTLGNLAEEALQYAQDHCLMRPGELIAIYGDETQPTESEDEKSPKLDMPMWARPVSRRIYAIQDSAKRATAELLFNSLLDFLSEIETNG